MWQKYKSSKFFAFTFDFFRDIFHKAFINLFDFISIQAMDKKFLITAIHFCCPNFCLDKNMDKCVKSNSDMSTYFYFIYKMYVLFKVNVNSTDLYVELLNNMANIRSLIKSNYNHTDQTDAFFSSFNQFYDLISNDSFNTNTNKKLTVYLWDNSAMINYIRESIVNGADNLNDLMSTILNHFVDFHHPTQSIIKNNELIKLNTIANKQLRLSTFNLYDVFISYSEVLGNLKFLSIFSVYFLWHFIMSSSSSKNY